MRHHGCDLGGAVMVNGENEKGDSNVVSEVLGEERTDRSVDNAGGKDSLLAGTAFSLEVGTGDAAYGVESFLEVDGKGKEVDTVTGTLGCSSASENCCIAVTNEHGTVSKTCHFTGLYCERTACKCCRKLSEILKHFSFSFRILI